MHSPFIPPCPLQTAVLFLVFNRPDTTARVLEAIRRARPPRLYVAADGPRKNREGETERVARVRQVATAVDWPCKVSTLFREKNLGCKYAVSAAISWFFEQEEQGIILEDDCLPSLSFFWFCEEMLARFHAEEGAMAVTGTNITQGIKFESDYFFSSFALMWGWASWARAWRKYDRDLISWPDERQHAHLVSVGVKRFPDAVVWREILNKTKREEIDTWDYQWIYTCWLNKGLTVAPSRNLIRNIGYSDSATHTRGYHPILTNLRLDEHKLPLSGPRSPMRHFEADAFISKHWFGVSWASALKAMALRTPGIAALNRFRKARRE